MGPTVHIDNDHRAEAGLALRAVLEISGFAADRLMALEVGAAAGAAYCEKNPQYLAQRNGYRDRDWETRAGTSAFTRSSTERVEIPWT